MSAMILDRLPQLESMTTDEQWSVVEQQERKLLEAEAQRWATIDQEPMKTRIHDALEKRYQEYLADPSTAISLDEMDQRIAALKESRRQ